MSRFIGLISLLALTTVVSGPALARKGKVEAPPKKMDVKTALRVIPTGQGDSVVEAIEVLRAKKDLLKKYGRAMAGIVEAAPADNDVAERVLSLVRDRGDAGCDFVAGLIARKNEAWVREVLQRYPLLPHCDRLIESVAGILKWIPDPGPANQSEHLASQVFGLVAENGYRDVDESACRLVRLGSDGFRRTVIGTILRVRPPWGDSCLIQAYMDEMSLKGGSPTVRQDMLRAISKYSGVDSVPTLVLALNHDEDRQLACDLLKKSGAAGAKGLVFAMHTSNASNPGVNRCVMEVGEPAIPFILPYLDHHSEAIRGFALKFLSEYRSPEALKSLTDRFDDGGRGIPKGRILMLLVGYPVADIRETLESALADPDGKIRMQTLDAIEKSQAPEFTKALLETAEGDRSVGIRARALEVAWHLGVDGGEALAMRMAQYEKPLPAISAIRILGYMNDRKACDVLRSLRGSLDPIVAKAATESLWLQTFEDPEDNPKCKEAAEPGKLQEGREIDLEGAKAVVIGDDKPLAVVLPGGPGMDFTWARPYLDDLSDDATVAFLEPEGGVLVGPAVLDALLDGLERESCVLVSMGLGGTAALWLSTLRPDVVDGVAVISTALPGHLEGMDEALVARLEEPFKSLVAPLIDKQALFRTEALSRYVARNLAPALVGDDDGDPWDFLGITWDVARTGLAFSLLSRPEVRFAPTEFPGKVLAMLPAKWLPEDYMKTYQDVAAMAGDRFEIRDMTDCGFMPQVTCESKVVGIFEDFIEEATKERD